jgi:aspartyl-tRNA(Asn)/glutamyl-tRNA(Gln) amidotransferase subunit B
MTAFTSPIVIGLEIHAELNTRTKLFCSCSTERNDQPNSRTCPTCLGMPGSKPVLNKKALDFGLKICVALECGIAHELVFSRKSYFYPDMSKNYQITQYELPLGTGGQLRLPNGKKIGLSRVHIEEDPAHSSYVLVDYNRSGNPLVEIVTNPDMRSPDEARDFLKELITVLDYLSVFDVNEGSIKADANVSIQESGYSRVEIKNITGFKEIERALTYEVARQEKEIRQGKRIVIQTRSWDSEKGVTLPLRLKETEEDYGYIIDTDLVPIPITKKMIGETEKNMPELAQSKLERFKETHGIEKTTAHVLARDKHLAAMYEAVSKKVDAGLASKWIRRELPRVLNYNKKTLDESGITSGHLISLLRLIHKKKITEKTGQRIIEKLAERIFDVDAHVREQGMSVVSNTPRIEQWCREAVSECPSVVDDYKRGEKKAFNFLVGQVMKKSKGMASPKDVNAVLGKLLKK